MKWFHKLITAFIATQLVKSQNKKWYEILELFVKPRQYNQKIDNGILLNDSKWITLLLI